MPADTELARAIAVLARVHQDATWRRTRAGNELRSLPREFHPEPRRLTVSKIGGLWIGVSHAACLEIRIVAVSAGRPLTTSMNTRNGEG